VRKRSDLAKERGGDIPTNQLYSAIGVLQYLRASKKCGIDICDDRRVIPHRCGGGVCRSIVRKDERRSLS